MGVAVWEILSKPLIGMVEKAAAPFKLVPRVFLKPNTSILSKALAAPPAIIEATGSYFKPALMVGEPVLRTARFVWHGDVKESLKAGLDLAQEAGFYTPLGAGKNADGSSKSEQEEEGGKGSSESGKGTTEAGGDSSGGEDNDDSSKRRRKRSPQEEGGEEGGEAEEAGSTTPPSSGGGSSGKSLVDKILEYQFDFAKEKELVDNYHGGPPSGGYKLGQDISNAKSMQDRILASGEFLQKAGGQIWKKMAQIYGPALKAGHEMAKPLWSKGMTGENVAVF